MLRYFFEDTGNEELNEENRHLFDGLAIADAGEKYTSQMQQYPVISLTLKSAQQESFDMAYSMLKEDIASEFARHEDVVLTKLESSHDVERYKRIRSGKADDSEYYSSLAFLTACLYKAYGKKSIILIDEYDVPAANSYYRGFYDKMIDFIRSLFECAFKTNINLEFAIVTGCLHTDRENIFGLNNIQVISICNQMYSEYFGFTEKETEEMLAYYDRSEHIDTIREWYDGYQFGNTEVYNPWSLLRYVSKLIYTTDTLPEPYWANTSSNSIVRDLIYHADDTVKGDLEILMSGGSIHKPVHEDITYGDIHKTQDNLWNFLFFTGYLKKVSESAENGQIYVDLAIPNVELELIYRNQITEWFNDTVKQKDMSILYNALFSGDAETLQTELNIMLKESVSYFDGKEAFYHGFLLGVFSNLDGDYVKKSNREAGNGRYDICVYNRVDETKPAAVIELKTAKKRKEMETAVDEALAQIAEKGYDTWLGELGYEECWHVGIGFFRKSCEVKIEKAEIEQEI
jgi:hypothetical protein